MCLFSVATKKTAVRCQVGEEPSRGEWAVASHRAHVRSRGKKKKRREGWSGGGGRGDKGKKSERREVSLGP